MIEKLAEKELARLHPADPAAERAVYGRVCGTVGIFLNLFLSAIKIAGGMIAGSLSVTADGFNNLSDVLSSAVTLIGFRLSSRKPDREHPYGHGRYEYLTGAAVSVLILLFGWELLKSAYGKLIHPAKTEWDVWTMVILGISVLVKAVMWYYNRYYGKKYASDALHAVAKDSRNDLAATLGLMAALVLERTADIYPDGFFSLCIALFILWSGARSLAETADPLLGRSPEPDFVDRVREIVMSEEGIYGMHDLSVHDYGPGKIMISLHAEVPAHEDFVAVHDRIDRIEKRLREELGVNAVIHADPREENDPRTAEIRELIRMVLEKNYPSCSAHDLHVNRQNGKTVAEFDLLIPYEETVPDETVRAAVEKELKNVLKDAEIRITVDKAEYL